MESTAGTQTPVRTLATVAENRPVSSGLWLLEVDCDRSFGFEPGQFAMVNPAGPEALVFSRPFSILAVEGDRLSLLYRVVGRGTEALSAMRPGARLNVLAPLGTPFPARRDGMPALLVAGGVGMPPVAAWAHRFGEEGDIVCFGGRDGADVPWPLVPETWVVSVDRADGLPDGRPASVGLVTEAAVAALADDGGPRQVMACGPLPMLRAVADLAAERGWPCWLSFEEHMGCGYGVCKGCVVPVAAGNEAGWRNATCCEEGPVFAARDIRWDLHRAYRLQTTGD